MEHLGRPRTDMARVIGDDVVTQDHAHSFKIRYLYDRDFEYDGSRFFDFRKKLIETGGKAARLAPYLQSWLFFGLMKEIFGHICGIDFDWRDFVQAEEGRDYTVTDIPSWMDRYEKLRDPTCYRMIELGSKFKDSGSIEAWEKIQKLPSPPLASDPRPKKCLRALRESWHTLTRRLSLQKQVGASETPITQADEALPGSFVSRVDRYNKSRFIRVMANSSMQSFGSLPPSHRYSNDLTPADLFRLMFTPLTKRNLTRPEDETVCLATTLGTDIEPILRESSPEERMCILLTSIGTLPLGILSARGVEGSCQCHPDGRLTYQGPAFVSTRPFAVNKTGSYFTIEAADGRRYFVGIKPQPGLEIEDGEKMYIIIPRRPPLARDRVPQEVAILSLSPDRGVQSLDSEKLGIETQYEFTAWLFDLVLPGAELLVAGGGQAGQYHIWQPPKEHWWQLDADAIDIIPRNLLTEHHKVVIG
ncbi:hypothetical protein FBEOM_6863 [Fusarium beomiforme]|uniref:Uncharacterized protein n=1 Tax=Fusarium beomiforme TaxID=44412 RepID=A0A9P5DY85_9HYPO|nr:hypothetical protein FBEOM_6863 [Fusarium beomiforme]